MSNFIKRGTGLLLIDVKDSNPNGDPDRESDPRTRQDGRGEISPVSFKRKLRDLVSAKDSPVWQELAKELDLNEASYDILESKVTKGTDVKKLTADELLEKYWDVRVFGTTFLEEQSGESGSFISTGVVQFGLGVSLDPVRIEHMTTTKVLPVEDAKSKGMAPLAYRIGSYGLYTMPFFINATAAQKTQLFPFRFPKAMGDSDTHLQEYLDLHGKETGFSTEQTSANPTPKLSSMEYRILLSCLVDADYSDTAGKQLYRPKTRWEERLKKLDCYIRDLQKNSDNSQSERNQLRSELYDCCRNVATEEFIVYCDSPVGTGKTTAVMAHMLKSASKNGLRHIFVVMPYTNIISQTVDVLRKALVLDEENPVEIVVEHHHQGDFESPELRHLTTTWTAPIIVTTAVQFFETIASNLLSKLRKLHQLPGSGIIIDESHAVLPINFMPPAWGWITELTNRWGCRFCLCSGTSFKFWENPSFVKISDTKAHPLVSGELSEKLDKFENNRIHLNILMQDVPHFQNITELINCISQYHGSRPIVLNTVRSAAFLAITLRNWEHDVLHLSTALTPNDREIVINEVKHRLNRSTNYKSDWTLVATSCVECGIDFSFHYGFCELRSLQSYLQLGGRISRNNEYDDGSLICFSITADDFGFNPAFDIPRNVFTKQIQSGQLSKLIITNAVSESFDMECKEMGGLSYKICKYERKHAFVDVAKNFRVIPDDTITVIADLGLSENLRTGAFVSAQELQRGSVNIRKSLIRQLHINDSELPSLAEGQYDQFLGYMKTLL